MDEEGATGIEVVPASFLDCRPSIRNAVAPSSPPVPKKKQKPAKPVEVLQYTLWYFRNGFRARMLKQFGEFVEIETDMRNMTRAARL